MNDLTEVQQFALASTLQRIAPEHAAELANSLSFGQRMISVPAGAPDYEQQVRAALCLAGKPAREEIAAAQAAEAARQAAEVQRQAAEAAARRASPSYQWTEQDVRDASLEQLNSACARGQLTEQVGIPAPKRPAPREVARPPMPSAQEQARWNAGPPWMARRLRAQWVRDHTPAPAPAEPPVQYPHLSAGPRRMTNEELSTWASRRARLTPGYAGVVTAEDLAVAQPSVVEQWMNAGKLEHLGVPPQKQHGVRT